MIKNLRKRVSNQKGKKGFTLIELIIVVAIIAILIMIALPKFSEVKENANKKADMATAKQIQTSVLTLVNDDKITCAADTDYEVGASVDPGKAVGDYMQNGAPKGKSKDIKGNPFSFRVDANGNVTVSAEKEDGTQVSIYPVSALE